MSNDDTAFRHGFSGSGALMDPGFLRHALEPHEGVASSVRRMSGAERFSAVSTIAACLALALVVCIK